MAMPVVMVPVHLGTIVVAGEDLYCRYHAGECKARNLLDCFAAVQQRFEALPLSIVETRDPALSQHVRMCQKHFSWQPRSDLSVGLETLTWTYHNVHHALIFGNIPAAQFMMATAETRMAEARAVLNDVLESIAELEGEVPDPTRMLIYCELRARVRNIDYDYQQLQSQWLALDELIRDCGRVSEFALRIGMAAFPEHREVVGVFESTREELQRRLDKLKNEILAQGLQKDIDTMFVDAEEYHDKAKDFVSDLSQAVQEYQATEARGSTPAVVNPVYESKPKINISNATSGPGVAFYSHFRGQSSISTACTVTSIQRVCTLVLLSVRRIQLARFVLLLVKEEGWNAKEAVTKEAATREATNPKAGRSSPSAK